jgi:hypothetical protein
VSLEHFRELLISIVYDNYLSCDRRTVEWHKRYKVTFQMDNFYGLPSTLLKSCLILVEAGHILYLRILYPIHILAPKKDIISYPYPGPKKGYRSISVVKNFASIVTVSEQQKARPGSTAVHKSSTFYWIELKP